mmetsp:Transcript_41307/g.127623  ORF Transcript_41307/g.127623 Transcript_41307/m.127623 type:complete len:219 (-) Transcript_41307:204-860(-)
MIAFASRKCSACTCASRRSATNVTEELVGIAGAGRGSTTVHLCPPRSADVSSTASFALPPATSTNRIDSPSSRGGVCSNTKAAIQAKRFRVRRGWSRFPPATGGLRGALWADAFSRHFSEKSPGRATGPRCKTVADLASTRPNWMPLTHWERSGTSDPETRNKSPMRGLLSSPGVPSDSLRAANSAGPSEDSFSPQNTDQTVSPATGSRTRSATSRGT